MNNLFFKNLDNAIDAAKTASINCENITVAQYYRNGEYYFDTDDRIGSNDGVIGYCENGIYFPL